MRASRKHKNRPDSAATLFEDGGGRGVGLHQNQGRGGGGGGGGGVAVFAGGGLQRPVRGCGITCKFGWVGGLLTGTSSRIIGSSRGRGGGGGVGGGMPLGGALNRGEVCRVGTRGMRVRVGISFVLVAGGVAVLVEAEFAWSASALGTGRVGIGGMTIPSIII